MTYHPQKGRGYGQFCCLPWCSDNFHHVWSWYNYPFTSYSVFLLTCYVTLWLRPFDLGQWSYMVSRVVNRSINVRETLAKQLEPGQRRKCNLIVLLPCWTCVSATQYTSDGTNYDSFKQQYTNSKLPVRWWIRAGSSTVEASASQSPFPSSWQQSQPLYRLGGSRGGPDGERHLWWRCWQVTQMETQEHHRLTTGRGLHCCNTQTPAGQVFSRWKWISPPVTQPINADEIIGVARCPFYASQEIQSLDWAHPLFIYGDRLIDWASFTSHMTRIGHLGDILPSQSLG